MGYEGLDGSQDVANKEKKHPWEVFPEDDSADSKDGGGKKRVKTPEQREKEKARREKRKAKLNSLKAWVEKNKILAAGIVLAVIALIAGAVILIVNLTKPEADGEVKRDGAGQINLIIPDNTPIEEIATADYSYTTVLYKLNEATKDAPRDEDGNIDAAKFEDLIDEYIKNEVNREADKPAFELGKIVLITMYANASRGDYLLGLFDEQNLELGRNTRYIYLMAKIVYYRTVENDTELNKYLEILNTEYPPENDYLDIDTYEKITDENEIKQIREDLEKIKSATDSSSETEEEE